jgi:GGDEF domain-containing protein
MVNRILIIKDTYESDEISDLFKEDSEIEVSFSKSNNDDLRKNMRYDYYMIFIDYDSLETDFDKLIDYISNLNDLSLIFLVANEKEVYDELKSHKICFIKRPYNKKVLYKQLKNNISILESYRRVNDISHYPGNFTINEVLKEKIQTGSEFAIMYLDIDQFKAYYDYYGLYQANLVLKFLARVIYDTVMEYGSSNDFIGHVGGDDFALILNGYENVTKIGEKIVQVFESSLPDFYKKKDYDNGFISVLNRKGDMQKFGFISLSVVVITNEFNDYKSADEVYKQMAVIKSKAKQMDGSVLLQDNQE